MTDIVSINQESLEYFKSKWSRVFNPEDTALGNLRDIKKIKPTEHPDDLRYYPFTWGLVIERRLKNLVIWDICLNGVQKIVNTITIEQVKKHIFVLLKNVIPEYTDEEPILFNELKQKWVVYQGTQFSEITIGFKIENEEDAREWMGKKMLSLLIDEVIQALYINQSMKKNPLTA